MPLFQPSVLKSHLALLDQKSIDKAYKNFALYFLDLNVQDEIKTAKEEQFQATFLMKLFVNVFNYTLFPDTNYNLITEQKNETNARKADGAILKGDTVTAVIELKGTRTKDLESIRKQAFDYKNFNTGCTYVITSNFEKLRFYIEDASTYEEFDLFTLSRKQFELLYLCLHKDQLLQHVPKNIKEESLVEEEKITKSFYKDYSLFKRELWKDLAKHNVKSLKELAAQHRSVEKEIDEDGALATDDDLTRLDKNVKRTLFKKSQKLIDRFLFIFFAEDRGLLQPNYTLKSIEEWETVRKLGVEETLYDRFKKHFNYLDQGRKKGDGVSEIFAYNGGLFKPDPILDHIIISDDLLLKHTKKIATYDFESQVDVNILGHIFENSLNEIESVNAEIEGDNFDKQTSKRKKDGVFYTPKYITKYIVDNTVGKLCEEKKTELGFAEEEYYRGRKNRNKTTLEHLVKILDDYREWLLQLTICDPACGSGAFLNQALDFLINEHNYLDELKVKLLGGSMALSDIENTILENNIYGVDLNEESVEIAKLSLWLRTAQPRRKLNDLSANIKCGNSLIDAKAVAGDKAFKWETEFPQVFAKGGFDVVIGNPPYVPAEYITAEEKMFLETKYQSAFGRLNLYPIFYEKGINILRTKGLLGYITPYTILKNKYYKEARKFILNQTQIHTLIDFKGILVFKDAAVDSIVFILEKTKVEYDAFEQISDVIDFELNLFTKMKVPLYEIINTDDLSLVISPFEKIIKKISKDTIPMKEVINFNQGIITGGNKKYLTYQESELTQPVITGSDFNRYSLKYNGLKIIYDTKQLHRPRKKEIFEVPERIILRQTSAYPICTIETNKYYTLDTVHNGLLIDKTFDLKYILSLLNSNLFRFLYEKSINEDGKVFAQVKIMYIDPLPVKRIGLSDQLVYVELVDSVLATTPILNIKSQSFISFITNQFQLEKLSKKLQNWHELDFGDFIKELNKAIKAQNRIAAKEAIIDLGEKEGELRESTPVHVIPELTKKDEFEWMELFEEKKKEVLELQSQIHQTEQEIDQMVYELYGLSDEEIKIVEGS